MRTLIKMLIFVVILFSVCAYLILFNKSTITHCIQVENDSDFTGKYLKYSKSIKDFFVHIDECKRMDNEIDNGDGEKNGKIRWYQCPKGPDCEEVGNY